MHENAIKRVVSKLCNSCATKTCVGPYGNPCADFLDMLEEETKQCKTYKHNGQICLEKNCEEGTYAGT